ncbi:MAG: hypothetical protein ACREVN_11370 [Gammaproteobacteria bacterium]
MLSLQAIAAASALLGIVFVLLAIARLWRRRPLAATGHSLFGIAMLAVAAALFTTAVNLYTYERLTHEQLAAELTFTLLEPGRYRTRMVFFDDRSPLELELRGNEWQVDARIIKWQGAANLLGLDTLYRLDRISGRYIDIEDERTRPRTVYALTNDPGLDLWALSRRYERWLPWVDARYGSAAFLPMADGARFSLSVGQSGLIARPDNDVARRMVQRWQ